VVKLGGLQEALLEKAAARPPTHVVELLKKSRGLLAKEKPLLVSGARKARDAYAARTRRAVTLASGGAQAEGFARFGGVRDLARGLHG